MFAITDNRKISVLKGLTIFKIVSKSFSRVRNPNINCPGFAGEETASVEVAGFAGKTVQTWVGFISQSGRGVATSVYTGEVSVV